MIDGTMFVPRANEDTEYKQHSFISLFPLESICVQKIATTWSHVLMATRMCVDSRVPYSLPSRRRSAI